MSGLVSIIMPVYNGEKFLAKALRSVLVQTYTDWELIVVDDGSTDATPRIVAEVEDSRITYTRQINRGQAAALNRGLDLAQGVYVTTLDADDCLTTDSLLDRVRWLEAHPDDGAVYADGYICDAMLEPQRLFSQDRSENITGNIYPALINTPLFGTGACVLIRTDLLRRWHIRYDEDVVMCQDWDFYIRVAAHARFGYVDTPSVYYRVHPQNMTATVGRDRHIDAIIRTRVKVLESPSFAALGSGLRLEFLRRLLVNTLRDRPEDQEAILRSPVVSDLLPIDRARLFRWLAGEWILFDSHARRAGLLLREAQLLVPGDAKTAGLALLMNRTPWLARRALWAWRYLRPGVFPLRTWLTEARRKVRPSTVRAWR